MPQLWNAGPISIRGSQCSSSNKAHFTSSVNLHNKYSQLEEKVGNRATLKTFQAGREERWGSQETIKYRETMKLAKGLNDHLPSSVQTKVPCATLASSNETLSVPGKREGHTWYQDGGKCDRRWSEWAQEHLCFHDTGDSPLLSHDRLPTQD